MLMRGFGCLRVIVMRGVVIMICVVIMRGVVIMAFMRIGGIFIFIKAAQIGALARQKPQNMRGLAHVFRGRDKPRRHFRPDPD